MPHRYPRAVATSPATLAWRCAALCLGGGNGCLWNECAPVLRHDLDDRLCRMEGAAHGARHSAGRIEAAAFAAWLTAAAADEDAPARRRAGVNAALETAGTLPASLEYLPASCRFTGGDFAGPAGWAAAEWEAEVSELVDELVGAWEEATAALLEVTGTAPCWLVLGASNPSRGRAQDDALAEAIAAGFARVEIPASVAARLCEGGIFSSGAPTPHLVVRVPAVVARWLRGLLFANHVFELTCASGLSPAALEVGLGLWDPESTTAGLLAAIAAAAVICSG